MFKLILLRQFEPRPVRRTAKRKTTQEQENSGDRQRLPEFILWREARGLSPGWKHTRLKKAGFGKNCFKGIDAEATFKVPKKSLKNYAKWIRKPGSAPKTVTVK